MQVDREAADPIEVAALRAAEQAVREGAVVRDEDEEREGDADDARGLVEQDARHRLGIASAQERARELGRRRQARASPRRRNRGTIRTAHSWELSGPLPACVFRSESRTIWTHGSEFACSSHTISRSCRAVWPQWMRRSESPRR